MADQLDGINPVTNRPRCEESIGKYWLPNFYYDAKANGIPNDVVEKISERDFGWWDSQSLAYQEGILKHLDKIEYPINYLSCVLTRGNDFLVMNKEQHVTRSRVRAWQTFLDDLFESGELHELVVRDLVLYTKDYHGLSVEGTFSIEAYDVKDVLSLSWLELDKLNEN